MTTHLDLPESLFAHLRDESRITGCRRALNDELATLSMKKKQLGHAPRFFGLFSPSDANEKFHRASAEIRTHETKLRRQLEQFGKLSPWLHANVQKALQHHFKVIPGDYRNCLLASDAIDVWTHHVKALGDKAKGFIRDARAVATAMAVSGRRGQTSLPRLEVLGNLHATADWTQRDLNALNEARARFALLIDADGQATLNLPTVQGFRTVAWVNRLALLGESEVRDEAIRCETDAHTFINRGLRQLLAHAAETRAICERAAAQILQQNLDELLIDFSNHSRVDVNIDHFIAEITEKHVAARLRELQSTFETTPLLIGR